MKTKTDTPETDAVREMWFITPNVELGDGRPIHGNVVDVEFARRMERERNEARAAYTEETRSTLDMGKRIVSLEAECTRLHKLWHEAEADGQAMLRELAERNEHNRKLANASSVLWEEHKAFGEDVHGTEGLDILGSDSEGHAMMQAIVDETVAAVNYRHNRSINPTKVSDNV